MYTDGIKSQLSQEEVNEAIDLGAKFKDSPEDYRDFYRFGGSEAYDQHGYIVTNFYSLVAVSWQAARKYTTINKTDIDEILRNSAIVVNLFTYWDRPGLGKDPHVVLKQGDKIIQPFKVEVAHEENIPDPDYTVPIWEICVSACFAYSDIDPKAKTTIIFVLLTDEVTFEVDFSRYK
jgi:hypothetical protein